MTDGQQAELYDYNSYGFEEVTNNAPGGSGSGAAHLRGHVRRLIQSD